MKKIVVWGSLFVLLISSLNAFAIPRIRSVRVPGGVSRLSRRARPMCIKPVRANMKMPRLVRKISQAVRKPNSRVFSVEKGAHDAVQNAKPAVSSQWEAFGGKRIYQDQVDLARDVAKFYGAKGGQAYRGILNEELVLYKLPEGITYHPANKILPRVLDPQTEYILFNPKENHGQLIRDNLLRLFKKVEE